MSGGWEGGGPETLPVHLLPGGSWTAPRPGGSLPAPRSAPSPSGPPGSQARAPYVARPGDRAPRATGRHSAPDSGSFSPLPPPWLASACRAGPCLLRGHGAGNLEPGLRSSQELGAEPGREWRAPPSPARGHPQRVGE